VRKHLKTKDTLFPICGKVLSDNLKREISKLEAMMFKALTSKPSKTMSMLKRSYILLSIPKMKKTLQEFENLQNDYLGMTPKERKKEAGVILYKNMTKTRKKINSAKKKYMSELKKF